MRSKKLSSIPFALSALLTIIAGAAWFSPPGRAQSPRPPAATWAFQGRVYAGMVGDESQPLQGVTVSLYGANNPYPDPGVLIASTTTDAQGWYGLDAPDGYEFYSIRETDPPGYTSVGATTVDGTVRTSNWIEYVIPLDGKVLTGNKFWDQAPTTGHQFSGHVYLYGDDGSPAPLRGATVALHGFDDLAASGDLLVTTLSDANGVFTLTTASDFPFFGIGITSTRYTVSEVSPSPGGTATAGGSILLASSPEGIYPDNDFILEPRYYINLPYTGHEWGCEGQAPQADLLPQALAIHPDQVTAGDGAVVEARVTNAGGMPAVDLAVTFQVDGQAIAEETIPELPPCAATTVQAYWPGGSLGPHALEIVVDSDDAIPEMDEENNSDQLDFNVVFEPIRPWEPPDLIVEDLQVSRLARLRDLDGTPTMGG